MTADSSLFHHNKPLEFQKQEVIAIKTGDSLITMSVKCYIISSEAKNRDYILSSHNINTPLNKESLPFFRSPVDATDPVFAIDCFKKEIQSLINFAASQGYAPNSSWLTRNEYYNSAI